ncbi:hypothetical protein M4I21_05040 [Cellulophaga sp. 20_2_10]|uniref:hypothetical protein n=1 Tax=Cellulophaga sp. 20_2_10 TaxID=2942476 RepID=UPI00201ACE84|nr:hypothetical protein [Cellulophaga sp. 20_2_10]MCL5245163.1 hypothetical protein [Cellulophaga sp. 20_2_10]
MKLFYTNYGTNETVASSNAIDVTVESAIDTFLELLDGSENFLGLVDEDKNCIQFVNEDKKWLLDIPKPPNFENLQAYVNDKECLAILEDSITKNKISVNVKLYKVHIMDETLDDVLSREQNMSIK